ncbi:hypothetical protein ISF_07152 [Cordyceps fumosorosea ARSEF 2679]|uniref:GPI-anchored cell surface glycoprotein n=1 Tax=Cordyceps fumosorosea (strain ARSEF 2679) TaxID=1081104 RepID=A0A167Q2U8_CORFA|nr:hypothetical protein ISF_07152 [Cordyceps fumosorosea ARSEF 2679]OAA57231.1 hypothetical protein ISF_07152 [Cordyceps fumosorosea ARSEF 2679]
MSLNGLDEPQVTEAFQTAAAEPGGWFLLKYTSRDEVQLLSTGAGGIAELRTSIEEYDEDSPLYGYIKYRRRNVVLKYLPEDSSRLIQARVAVHFNFVCERFSPYDTVFEIDSATALTDTKLSAACSLHTASGSTASSTSSRKKRLVEIAEEDEDDQPASKRKSVTADALPPKTPVDPNWNRNPVTLNADLASSPEQSKFSAQDTAEPPTFVGADERPSTSDSHDRSLSSSSSYPYGKPKVKLGPRPSLDVNIRPQTAGNFRPVSAIPAGYKLFGKGGKRNKSRESNNLVSPQEEIAALDFGVAPEVDDATKENTDPTLAPSSSQTTLKPAKKISPEKARLKKAMQLREKKRLAAQKVAQEGDDAATPTDTIEAETEEETVEDAPLGDDDLSQAAGGPSPEETPAREAADLYADAQSNTSLADQASEATATDSHPASPALEDSETADSTKASSISDATDETVHEKEEAGETTPQQKEADALARVAALPDKDLTHMTTQDHIRATEAALFGSPDVDTDATEEPVAIPISKFSTNNSGSAPIEESTEQSAEEPKAEVKEVEKHAGELTGQDVAPQPSAQDLIAATRAAAETPAAEVTQSPLATLTLITSDPPAPATSKEHATATTQHEVKESSTEVNVEAKNTPRIETETAEPVKEKRKGLVEPIRTTGIDEQADASRTPTAASVIAETGANPSIIATPVTPITPDSGVMAMRPSTATNPQPFAVRTVSNPVRGNLISPSDASQSSVRSMSSGAAYLNKINQQQQQNNANLSSKSNVGSSISQRIKALEMLSANSGAEGRPASRERPQSTFFSVKKSEPLRAPSVIERASSLRMAAPPSRDGSDSSPETSRPQRGRSGSISNRLSMFQPSPSDSSRGAPESISVMAKIVRDPDQQANEPHRDASGFNPLDLKQSPLFVSHQKPTQDFSTASIDTVTDSSKDDGRRSSVSLVRGLRKDRRTISTDPVPATSPPPANGSFSPRMSFSSRRSTGKESEEPQSPDLNDALSGGEEKSSDSKLSRATRFMRRLSNLSGTRAKTTPSPTVKSPLAPNEDLRVEASRPSTTGTSPWIVSYLGDVNVQFPDNLLWKRRNMCIDSQGFLVLSALPAPSSRAAQGTKRYHLSEFRPPYCPDVEVQELPNSVVLDFVEGTSLQLACEDRTGQVSVLNDLTDAHSKHAAQFGQ